MQTVHIHIYNVYKWYRDEHNTSLVFAHLKSNEYQAALCHLEGKKRYGEHVGCLQRPGWEIPRPYFSHITPSRCKEKTNKCSLPVYSDRENAVINTCHYL